MLSGVGEALVKYLSVLVLRLNPSPSAGMGTPAGGEFDWGGRLPKGNGGAQWSPRREWKPREQECTSTRRLDCETDVSSRWETRVE